MDESGDVDWIVVAIPVVARLVAAIQSRRAPPCSGVINPNLLNQVIPGALISRKQASLVQKARLDHAHDLYSSIRPARWTTP
jgi:hypothetical protein